jgi:PDZ domain-containing protein/aspartyl protease
MTLKNAAIVAVGCVWFTASTSQADERLWLDAKINGKRARLCFDSGAEDFILWREGVQRLGLNFVESPIDATPSEGKVGAGITEVCTLSLEGTEGKTRFRVLELPSYMDVDFDGVIGWWGVRNNIFQIDAAACKVTFLAKVPKKTAKWARLGVVANSSVLKLEIPYEGGTNGIVCVDTGSDIGVALAPQKWQAWKALHAHQAMNLNSFFTPGDGLVVKEEGWANELSFGSLKLTGLPVTEATPTEIAVGGRQYEGTLGLAALRRLDFIIDSKRSLAYLRAKVTPPPPYQHNRLGAAFVPSASRGDELIARVAAGSPAQEAGVENGDLLLKVDGIDITLRNTDGMKKFWMAAGTKVNLTLKRNGKVFETTATLREILSPTTKGKR